MKVMMNNTPAASEIFLVELTSTPGWSAAGLWNHKSFPLYGHTLWVIGPEHAKTIGDEGWSKARVKQYLYETIRRPARELGLSDATSITSRHSRAREPGVAGQRRIAARRRGQ